MKTLKSICILFAICMLLCGRVSAQWETVFNDTTVRLNDVRSFKGDTVLACGYLSEFYAGNIRKSFDGGYTWHSDTITYPDETYGISLLSIFPADDTTIYFGVKNGIFKTTDFCENYEYCDDQWGELIYSAYFTNKDTGILAAWPLSVTYNGGLTITVVDSGFIADLIFVINDTLLYISGHTFNQFGDDRNKIVRTSDFGESIDTVYILESELYGSQNKLCFVNALEAYLNIEHEIYHTTDCFETLTLWHTNDALFFDNLNFLNGRLYFSAADDENYDNDSLYIGFIDTLTNLETIELREGASEEMITKLYLENDTLGYAATNRGRIFRNKNIGAEYTDIIEPLLKTYKMQVSPNPASNILTVRTNERGAQFIITNIYGRILPLKIKEEGNGICEIDLSETAPGIYLIVNRETEETIKFIRL